MSDKLVPDITDKVFFVLKKKKKSKSKPCKGAYIFFYLGEFLLKLTNSKNRHKNTSWNG